MIIIEIKYHPNVKVHQLPSIGARSAAEYFLETWSSETINIQAKIGIMVLSKRYQVLGIYETIDCQNIMRLDPKYVFMAAINTNACAVAIAITHNSVSQNYHPDFNELNLLNRLLIGGKYLGIDIWDFIIIAKDAYYSFRDHGFLDKQAIHDLMPKVKGELCLKGTEYIQPVLKPVSLENILKESYQCSDLNDKIEKLCFFDDPLKDGICSQINGPLAEEVAFILAIMAEKERQLREDDSKLQGLLKEKTVTDTANSSQAPPKSRPVTKKPNGVKNLYRLVSKYKQCPELLQGSVRSLTIKAFWRESHKLQNNGMDGRECCQITLLGNWIDKTGFCTHEKVQVIPLHRMLIIIPE